MKIDTFFAGLKRRNVYNVAVACAIGSWLLIQAGSIFPHLRRTHHGASAFQLDV
jgi:hypothetical protein